MGGSTWRSRRDRRSWRSLWRASRESRTSPAPTSGLRSIHNPGDKTSARPPDAMGERQHPHPHRKLVHGLFFFPSPIPSTLYARRFPARRFTRATMNTMTAARYSQSPRAVRLHAGRCPLPARRRDTACRVREAASFIAVQPRHAAAVQTGRVSLHFSLHSSRFSNNKIS